MPSVFRIYGLSQEDCRAITRLMESTGIREMSMTQNEEFGRQQYISQRFLSSGVGDAETVVPHRVTRTRSGGLPATRLLESTGIPEMPITRLLPWNVASALRGEVLVPALPCHPSFRIYGLCQVDSRLQPSTPLGLRWYERRPDSGGHDARRAAERAVGSAFAPRQAR